MDIEIRSTDGLVERSSRISKGGLRTMPFIIANEAFEKLASYGLVTSMILYLMREYHMGVATGTNWIFFWNAATNFSPLVGAFFSDSFLGRFLTIGFGSMTSLLGMILLWLTAMIPQARPPPCSQAAGISCKSPTDAQLALLVSSFALISIGAGGVRPCSLAFGADQLDRKEKPKNERVLESYFNWYYAAASVALVIAFTGIVYIQDHLGWKVGFGVPAILMFCSAFLFWIASPFYIKEKASKSLFTSFAQVLMAAYRNRKLSFPPLNSEGWYHSKRGTKLAYPTEKVRFLNKACIIRSHDITPEGDAANPWRLCTVQQVEELKALIKVMPLWSTGIMVSINVSQSTILILQASSMDRHLTSSFDIPAASFVMFTVIALAVWIGLYDGVLLPLASKLRGKPVKIAAKNRMGIGLSLSCAAMVVSGIVEHIRRRKAIQQGLQNNTNGISDMSAMWLVPQLCLNGIAEAFNSVGQNEFYYSEFPTSMSSIASCLSGLGMAVGNLLASVVLSTVDKVTRRGGNESWISNNINNGHYDNYYWLLAVMSLINSAYFLVCSWGYGTSDDQVRKDGDDVK